MPPAPNPPKPYLPYTQTFPAPNPDPADASPTVPARPAAPSSPPPNYPPAPPPGFMPAPVPVPIPASPARRRGRPGAPKPVLVAPAYAPPPVKIPPRAVLRSSVRSRSAPPAVIFYPLTHPRTRGNVWAVASLLCFLLSCLLFPLAIVFSLCGVIFGHMARGAIRRHPDVNNQRMANICLWANYIVLLLSIVALVGLVALVLALASGTISW